MKRITLWTPNNIDFEDVFSASKIFPEADFSKGKMLIILSLLEPNFHGGLSSLKCPSSLTKELRVSVLKYICHLRSKGVVEFSNHYPVIVSPDIDGLNISPIYQKGKYWNFFVSTSVANGYEKLITRLNEHPRINRLSKKHEDWVGLPYHPITSYKQVVPNPLNN